MTTPTDWKYLADCLRSELADYGGLLHLFEAQQRALFDLKATVVLQLADDIENHARALAAGATATAGSRVLRAAALSAAAGPRPARHLLWGLRRPSPSVAPRRMGQLELASGLQRPRSPSQNRMFCQ